MVGGPRKGQGGSSSVVSEEAFLKGEGGNVCLVILYRLSVPPVPYTELILLVRVLLHILWGDNTPMMRCLHPSEGGLVMPSVKIRQRTLQLKFLD